MPAPLIKRRRIRLACDIRKTDALRDLITSASPLLPLGGDAQLEVAVFDNGVLADLSNVDSVTLNISKADKIFIDGTPDITKTLAAADLNLALTQILWDGGAEDDCHFKIILTGADTNLSEANIDTPLHLILFAITTDVPAETVPLGETTVKLHDYGLRATGTPPVNDPLYYTRAQSDARFLGAMGVPFTALTGGAAGDLDALPTIDISVETAIRRVVRTISGARSLSEWLLIAGTTAEDVDAGIVRPDDYAAATNEKIWVRISGL
jgi:hypothetical protein